MKKENTSPLNPQTAEEKARAQHKALLKLVYTGLFAALTFVVFQFRIPLEIPPFGRTSFHLGNAVVVLAALTLGGPLGGLAGAIGLSIGDILDPVYLPLAPRTFLVKFLIGVVTGLVAHRLFHINREADKPRRIHTGIAAAAGLLFNVIFEPIIGYYYKLLIMGKPAAELSLTWNWITLTVNAVLSLAAVLILYAAIRKPFIRMGVIPSPESEE